HGADGFRAVGRAHRTVQPGETFGHDAFTPAGRAVSSCHWCLLVRLRPMFLTLFLFFLSALVIYFACEYFVNGIEWVGHRFQLGVTATGTVLAAFGTALPESAVTFMAVVFGTTPEQKDIGVGAAMGGPLVLATLAYAVVGLALWRGGR